MTEPWMFAWNTVKDTLAAAVHDAWAKTKLSHGFADHPFVFEGAESPPMTDALLCGLCSQPESRHHSDMIPFADLSDQIKAYDYASSMSGFKAGFESGYQAGLEARDDAKSGQ